jgi:YegS/Rv2252/BmrU family lipid kinase
MNRPRVVIFPNPIAGRGRGLAIAHALADALPAAGFDGVVNTQPPATADLDALLGATDDERRRVHAVVTIGGDGTIRAVADRLMSRPDPLPPILPVPLGTANLMVSHLGHPKKHTGDVDALVRTIAARRTRSLDAATLNGQLFLLMAGIGIDAEIVHGVARRRRGPITKLNYVLPAAIAMGRYDFAPLHVEVDGQPVFGPAPAMVFVGNVREYGAGFPVLTRAQSDDRLLDVCVLPCRERGDLVDLLIHTAFGEHVNRYGVVYRKARQIRVTAERPVAVQVDGDPAGHTPAEIALLPRPVPFIVPAA